MNLQVGWHRLMCSPGWHVFVYVFLETRWCVPRWLKYFQLDCGRAMVDCVGTLSEVWRKVKHLWMCIVTLSSYVWGAMREDYLAENQGDAVSILLFYTTSWTMSGRLLCEKDRRTQREREYVKLGCRNKHRIEICVWCIDHFCEWTTNWNTIKIV